MCTNLKSKQINFFHNPLKNIVFVVFLSIHFSSYAGERVIDPAEQLEREAYQKRVQKELARIPGKVRLPEDKGFRFEPFKGCLTIKEIATIGNERLKSIVYKKKKEYVSSHLSRCVSSIELNDLVLKLNTTLLDKGYITSRIEVEDYDKDTEKLTLKIQEGRIEKIKTTFLKHYTIFPGLVGKELKAQDLEQGLEQLNRLPSKTSIITLWPGEKVGGTIVKVDTKKIGRPCRFYLSFDNSGNQQTGQNVLKGNFSCDNLLALNDQLSIAGSKSGLGRDRSAAVTWKEEIPFGYYTFSYSGSYSDSQYDIDPKDRSSELTTRSFKNRINLSRTMYRGLNNHVSLNGSFWHYVPRRELNESRLLDTDQKLSVFEIGVHHDFHRSVFPIFRILTELSYAQGTKLFGAKKDSSDLGIGASHAQFKRYKLTSNYLWRIAKNAHLNGNLQLQYSEEGLPGAVKLPVLDEIGGIRGIKKDSLTCDDGIILRHDIVFPLYLASISQNKIMKRTVISPFLHGDIGWARNKGEKNNLEQFASVGGGIKVDLFGFHGQIMISKLVNKPTKISLEGWTVLFELSQKLL